MNSRPLKYAAIDIGSNTLHLLIAELTDAKEIKIIRDIQEPTRLSYELQGKGKLDSKAIQRSLKILEEFCQISNSLSVEEIRAVGTSVLRRAHNARQFIKQAQERCHLSVEVISGLQEAELVLKAVAHEYDLREGNSLIIDIGGGSTEFIFVNNAKIEDVTSLLLGCVDLTEQFFPGERATNSQCQALRQEVDGRLRQLPPLEISPKMVSLGGTATCLGSLAQGLKRFSPEKVNGMILPIEKIAELIDVLQKLSIAERIEQLGLQPLRADIILAGALIQQQIMLKYNIKESIISTLGVRYGLLLQMLEENDIDINKHKLIIL